MGDDGAGLDAGGCDNGDAEGRDGDIGEVATGPVGGGSGGTLMAHCHRGFWLSYASVQVRLHRVLNKEIRRRRRRRQVARSAGVQAGQAATRPEEAGPGEYVSIITTGHSLGGALASISALDFACCQTFGACLVCPTAEGVWTQTAEEGDVEVGAAEAAGEAVEAAISAPRHDDSSASEEEGDGEGGGGGGGEWGEEDESKAEDGVGPTNPRGASSGGMLSSFRTLNGHPMLIESYTFGSPRVVSRGAGGSGQGASHRLSAPPSTPLLPPGRQAVAQEVQPTGAVDV